MRVRRVALIVALALATAWPVAAAPQRDTRRIAAPTTAATAPTGKGSIAGTVVADAGGHPVAYASVLLIGTRTGLLRIGSTDREGLFSFATLPDDRYTIGVSKAPYLGTVAGSRRPLRPGSPVVLTGGAAITGLTIRLTLGATIAGTVFASSGQPSNGGSVIVQQRRLQNGEYHLVNVPGGTAVANDRGGFRIHGLPPGDYVVSAFGAHGLVPGIHPLTDAEVDAALAGQRPTAPPPAIPNPAGPPAPVYHPGTTRPANATVVTLGPGDVRENIDIVWETAMPSRLEGVVSLPDGTPLPATTVQVTTAPGGGLMGVGASIRVGVDGRFASPQPLPPGTYVVTARTQAAPLLFASMSVEAAGADISGLQLVLRPPLEVSGRIVTTGTSRPPVVAGHRLQLTGLTTVQRAVPAQVSAASATGEFRISNLLPGPYVFSGAPFFGASETSVTWGLGRVTVDGRDLTDRAIEVQADALPKEVVVTFTDQWQDVSGRVTNAQGQAVSDYTMLLFPVDDAYWLYGSRRHVAATPDSDGHYRLGGPGPAMLPAGEYYLAAVTDVSKDEQYDPAFLRALVPAAIKIVLAPGQRLTQDVRLQ